MITHGFNLLPSYAFTALTKPGPKYLRLKNLHTSEDYKDEFLDICRYYNNTELTRLNHLFPGHRNNKIKTIDPKLFDQIFY